jgi:hypothetical protein
MKLFLRLTFLISAFFISSTAKAQYGKLPPFQLQIEAIGGTVLPGMHSFAFAQVQDKWLIIGGRTNGLHGLNSNDGFPGEYKNEMVIVIDTTTWNFYQADLHQLPISVADPLRSANMQYIQNGDYLYMIGGYGYDSTASKFLTFPTLTAIHINTMIDAVINNKPIASCIRQVSDTNLRVCGGDLVKLGTEYYLMFGHNFSGRYTNDASAGLFKQTYCNRIKKFNLTDNGSTLTLSNFSYNVDTTNFHRRDLTTCPVVNPDGSFGMGAYGGVFQKNADMPYVEPILLTSNGTTTVKNYEQKMSQYTCAVLPVYDSETKIMYTTFFGGISLHDYNPGTGLVTRDTLLPFVSDITTLASFSNGSMEETVLPLQLPGLLGSNAKFVLNKSIAMYANEVINLKQLANTNQVVGYIIGGIHAQKGNFGQSTANNTIYRVYLKPVSSVGIPDESSRIERISIFPNPASQNTIVEFNLKQEDHIRIRLTDLTGKELKTISDSQMQQGIHKVVIDVSGYAAGFYLCEIGCSTGTITEKMLVK